MNLTFELLRPDDLIALTVETVNLRLDTADPTRPRLVVDTLGSPAILIYHFPPQAILEQAYFQTATVTPPPFNPPPSNPPLAPPPTDPSVADPLGSPGTVGARMSGASRLAFALPDDLASIDYSIEALLDWSELVPLLPAAATVLPGAVSAAGTNPPPITEPGSRRTAIELPYRMILSPNVSPLGTPAWQHARLPVEHSGRTELWHTRLGALPAGPDQSVVEASPDDQLPVRVVWSPDFVANGPLPSHTTDNTPFLAALSPRDRHQIVILNAGFSGYELTVNGAQQGYVPQPIDAERLFLSSLGGWLSSRGSWQYPVSYTYVIFGALDQEISIDDQIALPPIRFGIAALDLVEWDHIATAGRDHYVRVVYEGFLYPFGHRASLVKVTERKVHAPHGTDGNPDDSPVAYLRQRMYIVVRERHKKYDPAAFVHDGREMPFNQDVFVNVHVTPDIDQPAYIGGGTDSFRVNVGGAAYPFPLVGTDLSGAAVNFLAPLIFVGLAETNLGAIRDAYAGDDTLRQCVVRGRDISYADPTAGDTALKTTALYFTAEITTAAPPYADAPFLPSLDAASVTVPALTALTGQNTAVLVAPYQPYLDNGIDANAGVFVQIVGAPAPVAFSADKSGGFARPNIALSALSARKGLVSGTPDDAAAGRIDPAAYFGDVDAKLFGTISLGQLIPLQSGTIYADAAQNAPEIRTHATPNRRHPTVIATRINWTPHLQDFTPPGSPVSIVFDSGATLRLQVHIEDHLDGTAPVSQAHGHLTNFKLSLLGVIDLKINAITFDSANGAKSTVALQLATKNPITFDGPLAFIQTLADVLPPGLFGGSGPSITLTATALRVSYTLGLPPITAGVFSLQNIAIMAALDLPYLDGKPAVEFAFASRAKPFLVTVEIFGGGGFVHVVLDTDGVRMVEGAIEFGANFCLNLGVASGAVHAMAGIYFQLKGSSSDLTGFVDIGGEVSVLGIVSISIDLNLSLSWQHSPQGNVIQGRATLTVSVHVLFFSASVQLSVERSFSAGGADPKIDDLMNAADWALYAGAFT